MHFRLQLIAVADDGTEQHEELADLSRTEAAIETTGLTLAESKQLLQTLQATISTRQVAAYLDGQRACPDCGRARALKEQATVPFRTLFGVVPVPNPRWEHCPCQPHAAHTFRPLAQLLPERTSPELRYLETKWAARGSYDSTATLLHDVLPIDEKHSAVSVRNHVLQAAQRTEQTLAAEPQGLEPGCAAEREQLPLPDGPLAVGLDGGIVRARRGTLGEQRGNLFEVIAGKSILAFRRDDPEAVSPSSKCFALVQSVDPAPKRRLAALLRSQGLQANQQVSFFSDGGDSVRRLPAELFHPEAEHILDWFHLTMRLMVLTQCARGLQQTKATDADARTLERRLESVKHYLWHGNTAAARAQLADLDLDLSSWDYDEEGEEHRHQASDGAVRMLKYVRELDTYVRNNASSIVNYGERYRSGERISTGFVESTVNQVVSKRLVKKQQMQWTPEGAHLLLQVRTKVLNEEWEATFRTWYPGFRPVQDAVSESLAAA